MNLGQLDKYNETYEPEDYVIHDPSRAVAAGDYGLMIAVTGKEQADGYRFCVSVHLS